MRKSRGVIGLVYVVAVLILWAIIYIPPYERSLWKKCELNDNLEVILCGGYKAGEGITRIYSKDYIESNMSGFGVCGAIEVDASQMIPTGVYNRLGTSSFEVCENKSVFERKKHPWGQLYEVTLESNERVLVLIDDYIYKVPEEGTIVLPIYAGYETIDMSDYGTEFLEYTHYCDCATNFAQSEEYRDFIKRRSNTIAVAAIVTLFAFLFIVVYILVKQVKAHSEKREK